MVLRTSPVVQFSGSIIKQDSTTIEPVVGAFQLSSEERQFLLAASKGEGLFFARGSHVALKVEASPLEHRLATTAPRELAEQVREPAIALGEDAEGQIATAHTPRRPTSTRYGGR